MAVNVKSSLINVCASHAPRSSPDGAAARSRRRNSGIRSAHTCGTPRSPSPEPLDSLSVSSTSRRSRVASRTLIYSPHQVTASHFVRPSTPVISASAAPARRACCLIVCLPISAEPHFASGALSPNQWRQHRLGAHHRTNLRTNQSDSPRPLTPPTLHSPSTRTVHRRAHVPPRKSPTSRPTHLLPSRVSREERHDPGLTFSNR